MFSLGGVTLPDTFVYGISYNTNTWGYPARRRRPVRVAERGPQQTPPVAVGTDVDPDSVWRSTGKPSGPFASDSGWSPYAPAVRFTTLN